MSNNTERRRYPRTRMQLAVEFYKEPGRQSLARGTTLDVSPVGLLAECSDVAGISRGQEVCLQIGPSPKAHDGRDGHAQGRVCRVENGNPGHCAVEVVSDPSLFFFGPELLGTHPTLLDVKRKLRGVVGHNVNVLIQGESGTGKNVAAEMAHRYSGRSNFPFVRVNCPSIPDTLFSSQLFGSEKGAFTDARSARPGLFRIANRGTILLDEICAIPSRLQAKLLEVIETKRFIPVGGTKAVEVDVRVIATTNANLEKGMREGSFREDLFYRLNEVELTLPTLRERRCDIPLLADHFLRKYCSEFGKEYLPLDDSTMEVLIKYAWPGNVRELENTIKRWVLMGRVTMAADEALESTGDALPSVSPGFLDDTDDDMSLHGVREAAERQALVDALQTAGYDKPGAAALLRISPRTLHRKINGLFGSDLPAPAPSVGSLRAQTPEGHQASSPGPATRATGRCRKGGNCRSMKEVEARAERGAVVKALEAADYNKTKAAAQLGVCYRTLLRKIKRYAIEV